uniref:Putative secreted protein n=1 Tax=Anopheles triannulatus TaxID=58253 RepID=A0A2M4B1J6_9DIPT
MAVVAMGLICATSVLTATSCGMACAQVPKRDPRKTQQKTNRRLTTIGRRTMRRHRPLSRRFSQTMNYRAPRVALSEEAKNVIPTEHPKM